MEVTRYEPWSVLNQVQNEMSRLFESRFGNIHNADNSSVVTSNWTPTVDIKEEDTRFVLYADLPGIDPKDIEITMDNGVLSVKGQRVLDNEEARAGYKRVERAYGTFYRRFSLPDTADAERIEATGRNGVLEIVIPKHERVQPRKIAVHN
ncbi:MAG: Hsp20/alpha crystallin family protein [Gammaproteobacteria bacterium]